MQASCETVRPLDISVVIFMVRNTLNFNKWQYWVVYMAISYFNDILFEIAACTKSTIVREVDSPVLSTHNDILPFKCQYIPGKTITSLEMVYGRIFYMEQRCSIRIANMFHTEWCFTIWDVSHTFLMYESSVFSTYINCVIFKMSLCSKHYDTCKCVIIDGINSPGYYAVYSMGMALRQTSPCSLIL